MRSQKNKNTSIYLTTGGIVLVLCILGWFIFSVFEGEKPQITVQPFPEYLSKSQEFTLALRDLKRGLKTLQVVLDQEGREITILNVSFPFEGFSNKAGVHRYETKFTIDPSALNLAQGRVDVSVRVWDHSRRSGGDGNMSIVQHSMVVDTIPPSIRALSNQHYISTGGTALVVYQTSLDSVESGIFVDNLFFKGFPAKENQKEGYYVCYFTVPEFDQKPVKEIYLWTEDRAGNRSRANFYYHIRRKRFRTDRMNITDRFLSQVLPYFSFYSFPQDATNVEKFVHVNRDLRKENGEVFFGLRTKTSPDQLWEGEWLRLENAATMAKFGDRRVYYYNGKEIDRQTHRGVDLASLAGSEVQAANSGKVIFAERLGIYGNTVVVDHGQGLGSTYSHLSQISVSLGQDIEKGQTVGLTGMTGLAGGDHLHYGVMVGGIFVNPVEWWDPHWIQDNILKKQALLN